jgi:SAM-dependent methyltransferase
MNDRAPSPEGLAELYDLFNPWGPGDDFYLGLVMAAEAVLDVGCGTGVLLHRAREAGHTGRLCGLDPDEAMLSRARRAVGRRVGAERRRLGPVETPVVGDVVRVSETLTSPAWDRPHTKRASLGFLDVDSLASYLADAGLAVDREAGDDAGTMAGRPARTAATIVGFMATPEISDRAPARSR